MKVLNLVKKINLLFLLLPVILTSCSTTKTQFFPDNQMPEDSVNWPKNDTDNRGMMNSPDGSSRNADGIKIFSATY